MLTFNLDDLSERERVLDLLRTMQEDRNEILGLAVPLPEPSGFGLVAACRALVTSREGYGEPRLGYLRMVAQAGDEGVSWRECLDHFAETGSDAPAKSYGATHSNIEQKWKGSGGQQWAEQIIYDLPDGRQAMYEPAREIMLQLLVPDPADYE